MVWPFDVVEEQWSLGCVAYVARLAAQLHVLYQGQGLKDTFWLTPRCTPLPFHGDRRLAGQSVWFDVKMADRSSAAMKKGVENAQCVIAIITGPCDNPDCPDDLPASNAYFARPYCVSELRWAKEAGVKIQPVIRASDKSKIAELMSLAPDDLQFLCDIDFITLDRSDNDYWAVGIKKLMRGIGKAAVDPSAPPPPAAVPAPVGYPAPAPAFGVPGQPMAAPMAAPYGAYPAQPAYGVPQQPVYGQTVAMAPTVTPYTAVVQTPYMGPPASQFPQHHHHHHGGHHHHSGLSHPIHQIHRHSGHHHSGLNHPIHQIHNRHRHGGHHHNHHNHHHGGSHFDIGVSFGGDSSFGNDDSFGDDMSFGD